MSQKSRVQQHMTEEEEILGNPLLMKMIEESEEAKRKGVKPLKLPQP